MQTLQITKNISKISQDVDFLASSVYEMYDLRDKIKDGQKFIIRQGDLIVSNYVIDNPRRRGLRDLWLTTENGVAMFRGSHIILETKEFVSIYHPEHGLVILPARNQRFSYYTIDSAID